MLGMHGTYCANMAVTHSDLLLAMGARFDDRVTGKIAGFAPNAKIVHIDVDPTSISKNVPVHIPIVGDCRNALQKLLSLVETEPIENIESVRAPWLDQVAEWGRKFPLSYEQGTELIKPQFVVEKSMR